MRSVTRSATTIGAVFGIGTRVRLEEDERLEDLAHLARGHRQNEAGEEREEAVELRHAADLEPREVELPLEKAEHVVAEGERARREESPPLERGERCPHRAEPAPDGERAVHGDAEEHDVEDATDGLLHEGGCSSVSSRRLATLPASPEEPGPPREVEDGGQ